VALPSPPAETLVPANDEATKLIAAGQKAYDSGKLNPALASFTKAVALRPDDAVAQLYLGLVHYELGQLEQAVGPLEKARALKPENSRADVLLGAVYQELGKNDLAKQRYQEYLKVTPKGEHAGEVRTILAGLGG
jgi:Flp pilus assembly protein TadD